MKRSSFVLGSFIVAFSSVLIRIISFAYQVFLIRSIGAEGIGIFHMILPIFMIALTITNSGLPTAISRLASKNKASNDDYYIRRSFSIAISFVFILCIIVSSVLLLGANNISLFMFGNKKYSSLIVLLMPAVLFVSANSLFRGLLYGLNKMLIASISEFIEHITRFISVILLVVFIIPNSSSTLINVAFIGISIGDFFALLYLYKIYKKTYPSRYKIISRKISYFAVIKSLVLSSIPLTLISISRLISQSVTAKMLPAMLIKSGFTAVFATETFGRIMGMTMPIVFAPFMFTSAIVINLIPSLTHQAEQKNTIAIKRDIKIANRLILAITIPLAILIFIFSNDIGTFLFNDIYVGSYIKYLSLSTVFLSVNHISFGILYGLQKGKFATLNRLIGTIILLVSIFVLVPNPQYNIYGFIYGFTASSIITFILDKIIIKISIKN